MLAIYIYTAEPSSNEPLSNLKGKHVFYHFKIYWGIYTHVYYIRTRNFGFGVCFQTQHTRSPLLQKVNFLSQSRDPANILQSQWMICGFIRVCMGKLFGLLYTIHSHFLQTLFIYADIIHICTCHKFHIFQKIYIFHHNTALWHENLCLYCRESRCWLYQP